MRRPVRMALGTATVAAAALLALAPAANAQADPVVAAAGDIACDPESEFFNSGLGTGTNCRQKTTSDGLVADSSLDAVLVLGDVQYENNEAWKYTQSYDPSWGRVKSMTRPAIGNHEYHEGSGDPPGSNYFDYFNGVGSFGGPAGDRDKGYYSFDVGSWHLIALNSMCSEIGGCGPDSPQNQWLRADLDASSHACALVYLHHPLYSSGNAGNYDSFKTFWQTAYDRGADLVLSGHDHVYERFGPQDANGNSDSSHGLRQFVVGTGGKNLGGFRDVKPHSQRRDNSSPGVLKVTLGNGEYDWRWVRNAGAPVADSGSATCHGRPPNRQPTASTGRASSVGARSARLNAAVNPQNQDTTYHFEYGTTSAYGSVSSTGALGAGDSTDRQATATLRGLRRRTTYHYRVVAQNGTGTVAGEDRTFTTGAGGGRYTGLVARRRGLESHWRLGDSGGFGIDREGRDLGLLAKGASLGQPGALVRDGDSAASFDGRSGEMMAFGPEVAGSATVEGWFLWHNGVALMRDDSFLGGWILAFDREGEIAYRVADDTRTTGLRTSELRDGNWHHVAMTKSGESAALYVDGDLVDTSTGVENERTTMPWHVMRNGPHPEFSEGLADEVAVYDRALSRRSIEHHYDAGKGRRLRKTAGYRPRGHFAASGRVIRRRRALRRLFSNDGVALLVRARRGVASSNVSTRIRRRQRRTLRRIAANVNGGASANDVAITLRAYDFAGRRWVQVAGPRTGMRADGNLRWSESKTPKRFVSRGGRVRIKITGTRGGPFRLRTDQVRFIAQY